MEAFYRSYLDAINAHEFTRLGEFVAEDVVANGDQHGLPAYIAGLESVVAQFPDHHWDLRHLLVDEPWLAAHFINTGTHAATGRRITTQEFALYRIEAETIVEVWGTADDQGVAEQLATTTPRISVRPAQLSERSALEDLQRRSSMHQPMYREQLAAHPDAIELPEHLIRDGAVRVAEQDGTIVGFSALLPPVDGGCELDGLFVEPAHMRQGIGRELIDDAMRMAREQGATRIDVVANPQALAFYERVGFATVGEARTRFGTAPRMSLLLG